MSNKTDELSPITEREKAQPDECRILPLTRQILIHDGWPRMMKPYLRVLSLFFIVLAVFIVSSFAGSFLPAPSGRHIFTPWMEVITASSLLFLGIILSHFRWFRVRDLISTWCIVQVVVIAIVLFYAGATWSSYTHWLWEITRCITPPLAAGMVIGVLARNTKERGQHRNGAYCS